MNRIGHSEETAWTASRCPASCAARLTPPSLSTLTPWKMACSKQVRSGISGNPGACHFSIGTGAPNARFDPRGLETMSQLGEAVARLTQARSKLAPMTERLLDIKTRLAVVKAAVEPPAKFSLREFTFNLSIRASHFRLPSWSKSMEWLFVN